MDEDIIREEDRSPERRPERRPEAREREPRRRPPARSGCSGVLIAVLVVAGLLIVGVVVAALAVPVYLAYKDDAESDHARADVKMIGDACTNYNTRYGQFPNSLEDLVHPPNGGRPYFTADKLIDPWGQPYQYDPITCHPQTGEPLVYTIPPNGREIRNW